MPASIEPELISVHRNEKNSEFWHSKIYKFTKRRKVTHLLFCTPTWSWGSHHHDRTTTIAPPRSQYDRNIMIAPPWPHHHDRRHHHELTRAYCHLHLLYLLYKKTPHSLLRVSTTSRTWYSCREVMRVYYCHLHLLNLIYIYGVSAATAVRVE